MKRIRRAGQNEIGKNNWVKFVCLLVLTIGAFLGSYDNAQANPGFELPIVVAAGGERKWNDSTQLRDAIHKDVTVNLKPGSAGSARYIQMKLHNLQRMPDDEAMGALQVRVGGKGSRWVNLVNNNSAIEILDQSKYYGGMGGGFHSVMIRIDLNKLEFYDGSPVQLANTNIFKFLFFKRAYAEGASAFRVLWMQVRDGSNENILLGGNAPMYTPGNAKDADDYITATNTESDRIAGKNIWDNKVLIASPLKGNIRAKCGDCHTETGYDLKYFGYTNESIYKRSRFHGLSDDEAMKVTRYIRSLPDVVSYGRPWNPPYQPGVGMSSKNVKRWAAGAGHWKVLPNDKAMLPYVFPDDNNNATTAVPTDEHDVKQAFRLSQINSGAKYLGLSLIDTPIHLQLPDWNSWLPRVHPVDIWDDFKTVEYSSGTPAPYWVYARLQRQIKANAAYVPTPNGFGWAFSQLTNFSAQGGTKSYRTTASLGKRNTVNKTGNQFRDSSELNTGRLKTGTDGKFVANVSAPYRDDMFDEYAKRALTHWLGVKYFEVFHVGNWEDRMGEVFNDADNIPADRGYWGWPSSAASVFHNAPHKSASNTMYWEGRTNNYDESNYNFIDSDDQPPVTGMYDSLVWYHLEAILNPGNKQKNVGVSSPVDWAYNLGFCKILADESGRHQAILHAATLMKNWQTRDIVTTGSPTNGSSLGWGLRTCTPYRAYSTESGLSDFSATLDVYSPGLYDSFLTVSLRRWMQVVKHPGFAYSWSQNRLKDWPRDLIAPLYKKTSTWSVLPPEDYKPSEWDGGRQQFEGLNSADTFWRLLPLLDQVGVDRYLLREFKDWCKAAWPGKAGDLNDWDGRLANLSYNTRHVKTDRLFRFQNVMYPDRYLRATGGAGSLVEAGAKDARTRWWAREAAGQWIYLNQREGSESSRLYDRPDNDLLGVVSSSNNSANAMWRAISLGGGRLRLQGKVDKLKLINVNGGSDVRLGDYNWRPGFNTNLYPAQQREWRLVNPW